MRRLLPFHYEWALALWAAVIWRCPDYTAYSCIYAYLVSAVSSHTDGVVLHLFGAVNNKLYVVCMASVDSIIALYMFLHCIYLDYPNLTCQLRPSLDIGIVMTGSPIGMTMKWQKSMGYFCAAPFGKTKWLRRLHAHRWLGSTCNVMLYSLAVTSTISVAYNIGQRRHQCRD